MKQIANRSEYHSMSDVLEAYRFREKKSSIALPVMLSNAKLIANPPSDFIALLDTYGMFYTLCQLFKKGKTQIV